MRLFTGIDLPEATCERLARLLAHLRPTANLKWSPLYNLHITTKFIGEWPPERLDELKVALEQIPKRPAIRIDVSGLGWYPSLQKPRVFWAGVDGGTQLTEFASAIENAIAPLGIARETRPYSPHLTLARLKQPAPIGQLLAAIGQLAAPEFGGFDADRFHLYLSQPGAAGSVYTKLAQFPFAE